MGDSETPKIVKIKTPNRGIQIILRNSLLLKTSKDCWFKAKETKEAVKNINFEIKENEIVGLLGPNGSGKTTTIGMILGLLKPSSGEVLINGLKIEKYRYDILQKIQYKEK